MGIIRRSETEAMVSILMSKHGCPRRKALEIIKEHNGYLRSMSEENVKKIVKKKKEEKKDKTKNFSKHFREMKKSRKK